MGSVEQKGAGQFFFSPTFQCYTTPPFYRGLLLELDYVSWFVDQCKPFARAVIWKQLFALLGAKPIQCSRPFFPILRQWTESSTINLLAIELLYLAFATTLDCNPQLITANFEPKSSSSSQPTGCSGASPLGPLLQPNMVPEVRVRVTGEALEYGTASSAGTRPSQAQKEPRPLQPKPSVSYGSVQGRSVPQSSSSFPRPAAPTIAVQHRTSSAPASSYAPSASASQSSTGSSSHEVLSQLIDLQTWKNSLDQQPVAVKNTILATLKVLPHFNEDKFNTQSLARTIDSWATDIAGNMQMIAALHNTVSFLKSNGAIVFDKDAGKRQASSPPAGEKAPKKAKV